MNGARRSRNYPTMHKPHLAKSRPRHRIHPLFGVLTGACLLLAAVGGCTTSDVGEPADSGMASDAGAGRSEASTSDAFQIDAQVDVTDATTDHSMGSGP